MEDTPEAIRKKVKTYLVVGAVLFAGTVLTVLVASLEVLDFGRHGFDGMDALIGLGIALTKATLVALIFMHLNHEKKSVYWIFGGSFVFVAALYLLTAWAKSDPIHDPYFYGTSKVEATNSAH
jgi:caa(3)-type oxidase subunit IV